MLPSIRPDRSFKDTSLINPTKVILAVTEHFTFGPCLFQTQWTWKNVVGTALLGYHTRKSEGHTLSLWSSPVLQWSRNANRSLWKIFFSGNPRKETRQSFHLHSRLFSVSEVMLCCTWQWMFFLWLALYRLSDYEILHLPMLVKTC